MLERIGKYEIRREIGRGAMGVVYEGFDPVIGRRVAIKTLRTEMFEPRQLPDVLARFKREAQSAGRLSHPHIVTIHDYGEEQGTPYIVMEYMSGDELGRQLERGSRFALDGVVRIMTALLGALAHAHENGVVHRDLKPSNMFVLRDGSLKVVDFGIARVEASELTDTGTMLGTPAYMSPEQFLTLPVDARSDLYSAGVILYQLLTGDKPFTGSVTAIMQKVLHQEPIGPSILNPTLSPRWDSVVSRAMAKKPEARYQSARQFLEAVKAAHAAERGEREAPPDRAAGREEAPRGTDRAGRESERTIRVAQEPDPYATVPSAPKLEESPSSDSGEPRRPRTVIAVAAVVLAVLGIAAGLFYLREYSAERATIERARQDAERRAADAEERARKEAERANQEAEARAKSESEAARKEELRREAEAAKARSLKETERAKEAQAKAEAARREEELRREAEAAKARAAEVARKEAEQKTKLAALRADEAKRKAEALARKQAEDKARADAAKAEAARKAEEARKAEKSRVEQALRAKYRTGTEFSDCRDCPQLLVIPAGEFTMGSPASESGRAEDEGPRHAVRIGQPFALGKNEVTFAQFQRFVEEAGYKTEAERDVGHKGCIGFNYSDRAAKKSDWQPGKSWRDPGFEQSTDRDPVICVSWNDAKAYVRWLSGKTGKIYRLPTEAEWEYAARAGTISSRYWGDDPGQACLYGNVADQSAYRTLVSRGAKTWTFPSAFRHECNDGRFLTAPVGSYKANNFGLYDMLGNAWELTEDCWTASYAGAPADGSARLSGDCTLRVLRGGAWNLEPRYARSAKRDRLRADYRRSNVGFRVARTLE